MNAIIRQIRENHRRPQIPANWIAYARRMTSEDLSPAFNADATEDLALFLINAWADEIESEGRTPRASWIRRAWRATDMANEYVNSPHLMALRHQTALVRRAWNRIAREIVANPYGWGRQINLMPFINRMEDIFDMPRTGSDYD